MNIDNIQAVLNKKVRPYLQNHGGDLIIDSFRGGVLRVKMLGKCQNCPSAVLENEEFIFSQLCDDIPALKSVVVLTGVSSELYNEARRLLNIKPNILEV